MRLLGVMQHGGVELYELHIGHRTLGAIDHSDAVTRCDDRIRGGQIDGSAATRTHDGNLRKIGVYLLGNGIQHIGSIALDVG